MKPSILRRRFIVAVGEVLGLSALAAACQSILGLGGKKVAHGEAQRQMTVLAALTQRHGVAYRNTNHGTMVASIEGESGDLIYKINGAMPDISAAGKMLKPGDRWEWYLV